MQISQNIANRNKLKGNFNKSPPLPSLPPGEKNRDKPIKKLNEDKKQI